MDDQNEQDTNIDHETVKTDEDLNEVNEDEIYKKEIKFDVIDDIPSEMIKTDVSSMHDADDVIDTTGEKIIDTADSDVKSLDNAGDDNTSVDGALHSIKSVDSVEKPKVQEPIIAPDDEINDDANVTAKVESEQKDSLTEPPSRILLRRNSYTKGSIELNENQQSSGNINDQPASSTVFESSFGPVRQLKGKKKSYDYVRPKVDSYWSDDYHRQHQHTDHSPNHLVLSGKHDHHYKHHHHHHNDRHGGSMGYLPSTSMNDEYSRIDPKIINQTVEKYLRKLVEFF